ncbi:hypothetical protein [Reticulibacter mediterranei]|uniref:hypothetical protein n=1 Tax=Reticulibacter mediterranei TaxID=2778369 RepID=UPI001C68EA29|nr:hypothetical protein [Reticulibacter mediterranei]
MTQVEAMRGRLSVTPRSSRNCRSFSALNQLVMLVVHPLSGEGDIDAFHADADRFCVMLSRH